MIASLVMWHGPVPGFYTGSARDALASYDVTTVSCRDTSSDQLGQLLPHEDLLADGDPAVWLRDIDAWDAATVGATVRFLETHPRRFAVAVTGTKAPVKKLREAADKIHNLEPPKQEAALVRQLDDWLLRHHCALADGVASTLVRRCANEPQLTQQIAVNIAANPPGRTVTWDDIAPLVDELVNDKIKVWQLGTTIASGDTAAALEDLGRIDNNAPVGIMRYLHNRYRLALLVASRAPAAHIHHVAPNANDWTLKTIGREMRGLTPAAVAAILDDLATAAEKILTAASPAAATALLESAIIRTADAHRRAL